jgi:hypothetical protein
MCGIRCTFLSAFQLFCSTQSRYGAVTLSRIYSSLRFCRCLAPRWCSLPSLLPAHFFAVGMSRRNLKRISRNQSMYMLVSKVESNHPRHQGYPLMVKVHIFFRTYLNFRQRSRLFFGNLLQ